MKSVNEILKETLNEEKVVESKFDSSIPSDSEIRLDLTSVNKDKATSGDVYKATTMLRKELKKLSDKAMKEFNVSFKLDV